MNYEVPNTTQEYYSKTIRNTSVSNGDNEKVSQMVLHVHSSL